MFRQFERNHSRITFYYLVLYKAKSRLLIHGLWPERSHGPWPRHCRAVEWHKAAFQPSLRKRLELRWPSNKSKKASNEEFWKHEWIEHGSCTGLNELEYFHKTLQLFDEANERDRGWLNQWKYNNEFRIKIDFNFKLYETITVKPKDPSKT